MGLSGGAAGRVCADREVRPRWLSPVYGQMVPAKKIEAEVGDARGHAPTSAVWSRRAWAVPGRP